MKPLTNREKFFLVWNVAAASFVAGVITHFADPSYLGSGTVGLICGVIAIVLNYRILYGKFRK